MRQSCLSACIVQVSVEDELAANYSCLGSESTCGPLNLGWAGGSAEQAAACHAKAKQDPWQPLRAALLRLTRALLARLPGQPPVSSTPGSSEDAQPASSPSGSRQQAGLAAETSAGEGIAAQAENDRVSAKTIAEESCDFIHSLMGAPFFQIVECAIVCLPHDAHPASSMLGYIQSAIHLQACVADLYCTSCLCIVGDTCPAVPDDNTTWS